jgi:hypothetical protein
MTTRHVPGVRLAALVALLLAAGCGSDGLGAGESVAVAGEEPIVDWETFRASAVKTSDGHLLAEGDLLFNDEAELYAYWQRELAGTRGEALTVNQVPGPNGVMVDDVWPFPQSLHITYCVSPGFTQDQLAQLLPALDTAAQAWGQLAAVAWQRVTVNGTCDTNNTDVLYNVQPNTYTAASYPSFPRSSRLIYVNSLGMFNDFMGTDAQGRDLPGIMTHEFGHTLGFIHEHLWNPTCVANSIEPGATSHARQLTPYDQMSVMNYPIATCRDPPGGGYHIDQYDTYGAVVLYGLAPALNSTLIASMLL